jgi:excisionase family DNA binding protein
MNGDTTTIKTKPKRKKAAGTLKRLFSIPEAAFYLGRSVDALREMIWAGKIPCVRDGRRVLVDIEDMNKWIESSKTQYSF